MSTNTDSSGRGAALYRLLAWSSPAFPTGAFSYSHGLEAVAADGRIQDRASLQQWIAAIVLLGSGRVEADLLRDAYRSAQSGDDTALAEVNRRGTAYRATSELSLESTQQGEAFLNAWQNAWKDPRPSTTDLAPALSRSAGEGLQRSVCHAVAFGAAAASGGITLEDALLAYLQAFAGNLVSAGIRLGVIGQTDGQRILAALEAEIAAAVTEAMARGPDAFGGATFAMDIASMAHEAQYTRLFRS